MNIEQLKAMLQAYHELSSSNLSDEQMDRLVGLVAETHKQIEDLSASSTVHIHPEHGPHAPNRIGYLKYVCPTNPMGFCLTMQEHIQRLIYQIRTDVSRKAGMGLRRKDHGQADEMCGIHHPSNFIDLSLAIKTAVCLDADMWPFFQVKEIKGESKALTATRLELFCLIGVVPPTGIFESDKRQTPTWHHRMNA